MINEPGSVVSVAASSRRPQRRMRQRASYICNGPPARKTGSHPVPELRRRGVGRRELAAQAAGGPHGPWRLSTSPRPGPRIPQCRPHGSPRATKPYRTAVYGPVLPYPETSKAILRRERSFGAGRKARTARADARASELASIIAELREAGVTSLRAIAAKLSRKGVPPPLARRVA
jgi:hypothetical protein